MNESHHTHSYEWVTSHSFIWMDHITIIHMNESHHTHAYEWVTSHSLIWMSHITLTHMNESHHTHSYEWVTSHSFIGMSRVTHMNETHTHVIHAMTHSCVCHDSFMCVPWLIHVCAMTHSFVWLDSGVFVNRLSVTSHRRMSFSVTWDTPQTEEIVP